MTGEQRISLSQRGPKALLRADSLRVRLNHLQVPADFRIARIGFFRLTGELESGSDVFPFEGLLRFNNQPHCLAAFFVQKPHAIERGPEFAVVAVSFESRFQGVYRLRKSTA